MKLPTVLFLAIAPAALALGFANGVKIGEVTDDSAVIWTRLTEHTEASNRINEWDENNPQWTAPGADGKIRLTYWHKDNDQQTTTEPIPAVADNDYCAQFKLTGLEPATTYQFEVRGKAGDDSAEFSGNFTTAPSRDSEEPILFTVSTCQDFPRRDDAKNGHRIYRSMLELNPDFFVQTGDTLYYDKPKPLAKDIATARYKWNRLYSLPNLRNFHRNIPSYWMHDDHDVLKNDCWPGQTFGELTWDQGLKVWQEQIPQSELPYRNFRWGRHLEIWLPEGREFRSPNNIPDGPEKTIFGEAQWEWLEDSMKSSDATFKLFVSATPVVGPDRKNKKDNHANEGFSYEGDRLRKFLNNIPGCFVINGDRHWQYHSIDTKTGLNEFSCGAASDIHAGGWNQNNKLPEHQFLRVKGGFLSISVDAKQATVRHHDVDGQVVNETTITATE